MTPAVVARSGAPAGLSHDSERESRTVGPIRSFEGSFADAGALVAAMRARALSLPAPDSIAYVVAPGLLTSAGYLAFVDHLP